VHQGKVRAMHCLDLPFVFDHVNEHRYMTGNGDDRAALAAKMSTAWAAFVRTGNPNHSGLPTWAPFTGKDRTVMLFNTECRAVHDPYGEEFRAIAALREPRR
jgi:para-nitrobenzyl esterase